MMASPPEPTLDVFLQLMLWSTVYYFVERFLKFLLRRHCPAVSHRLDSRGKASAFFGISMGCLITLTTTPSCTIAYLRYPRNTPSTSLNFSEPGHDEVCLMARGILWTQELSRLGDDTIFLGHHILSLMSMGYVLREGVPLKGLYAIYASLVTELASNSSWLLGASGVAEPTSAWSRTIEALSALSLIIIRIPPVVVAWDELCEDGFTSTQSFICGIFVALYAAYIGFMFVKRAAKLGILEISRDKPGFIRLFNIRISFYGLCVSLGLVPSVFLTLYFHQQYSPILTTETSQVTPEYVSFLMLKAAAFCIIGSRSLSMLVDRSKSATEHGLPCTTFFRRRFYVQGSIIAGALAIWFDSGLPIVDRTNLLAAAAVVLPLYESIGRLGCHYAGCCHGTPIKQLTLKYPGLARYSTRLGLTVSYDSSQATVIRKSPHLKGQELFAVQFLMSITSATQFLVLSGLVSLSVIDLRTAAAVSMMVHAGIRIVAEYFRDDDRAVVEVDKSPSRTVQTISIPTLLAVAQGVWASWTMLSSATSAQDVSSTVPTSLPSQTNRGSFTLGFGWSLSLSVVILAICFGIEKA